MAETIPSMSTHSWGNTSCADLISEFGFLFTEKVIINREVKAFVARIVLSYVIGHVFLPFPEH